MDGATGTASPSPLVTDTAAGIFAAFEDYNHEFRSITRRAQRRFEEREWQLGARDAVERIELYDRRVERCVANLVGRMGRQIADASNPGRKSSPGRGNCFLSAVKLGWARRASWRSFPMISVRRVFVFFPAVVTNSNASCLISPTWKPCARPCHPFPRLSRRSARTDFWAMFLNGRREGQAGLFEGVVNFLAGLSAQGPILIVLEDLHWAAESTLQLLHYLARHLVDHSIMLIGTVRSEEVIRGTLFLNFQQALQKEKLCASLLLARLSASAVEKLILEMSGGEDSVEPLVQRLYRETDGNPFFLR